jgi:hypothetical protein
MSDDKLASTVAKKAGTDTNIRVGIVQSIDSASRITVNVGGGILTDMPFLASYSPAVGDNVNIARFDATWLVLGIVGSPGLSVVLGTVTSSTAAVTTSALVESDLPFLSSQHNLTVRAGHIYEFHVRCLTQQSVAGDAFQWRCRRDVAVTGTELAFQRFSNGIITALWASEFSSILEVADDDTFPIFWSLVRISGTGTITATPTIANTRSYMKVTDLGLNTTVEDSPWSVTL